jgi:hypothetical protein
VRVHRHIDTYTEYTYTQKEREREREREKEKEPLVSDGPGSLAPYSGIAHGPDIVPCTTVPFFSSIVTVSWLSLIIIHTFRKPTTKHQSDCGDLVLSSHVVEGGKRDGLTDFIKNLSPQREREGRSAVSLAGQRVGW